MSRSVAVSALTVALALASLGSAREAATARPFRCPAGATCVVDRPASVNLKEVTSSFQLERPPTVAEFIRIIQDPHAQIGAGVTVSGTPALVHSSPVNPDWESSGRRITTFFQVTGESTLVGLRPRLLLSSAQVTRESEDYVEIECYMIQTSIAGEQEEQVVSGTPYDAAINEVLGDLYEAGTTRQSVVTSPYSYVRWSYDRTTGEARYDAVSNPGGAIPNWLVSANNSVGVPKALFEQNWGVSGTPTIEVVR